MKWLIGSSSHPVFRQLLVIFGCASVLSLTEVSAATSDQQASNLQIEIEKEVLKDPIVQAFIELLELWNSGEITFQKADYSAQFKSRLEQAQQRSGDELEKIVLLVSREQRWDELPEEIKVAKPLSKGAILGLVGSFYDELEAMKESAELEASVESIRKAIGPALFVLLASSQIEASEDTLSATDLTKGKIWLYSLVYPFCCSGDDGNDQ